MAVLLLLALAQVALALAAEPPPGAQFGSRLASDGHTLVVTGRSIEVGRRTRIAVLVYERGEDELGQPVHLEVQGPPRGHLGGLAVDGGRIALGIWLGGDDAARGRRGAVVVLERGAGGGWFQAARVPARGAWSLFGTALDLRADVLVVGAPGASSEESVWGAVHLFRHLDGAWRHERRFLPTERQILASDRPFDDGFFGSAVAIRRDRVVVGVPGQVLTTAGGPVFVFDRRGARWRLDGLLEPDPEAARRPGDEEDPSTRRGLGFGGCVDVEGDTVVVGSTWQGCGTRGEVWVHERRDDGWSVPQVLRPPADSMAAEFGARALLRGDLLLVGSGEAHEHGPEPGAPYRSGRIHGYGARADAGRGPETSSPGTRVRGTGSGSRSPSRGTRSSSGRPARTAGAGRCIATGSRSGSRSRTRARGELGGRAARAEEAGSVAAGSGVANSGQSSRGAGARRARGAGTDDGRDLGAGAAVDDLRRRGGAEIPRNREAGSGGQRASGAGRRAWRSPAWSRSRASPPSAGGERGIR